MQQVQYYLQLAQQHHASLQNSGTAAATNGTAQGALQIVQPQQVQAVQVGPVEAVSEI